MNVERRGDAVLLLTEFLLLLLLLLPLLLLLLPPLLPLLLIRMSDEGEGVSKERLNELKSSVEGVLGGREGVGEWVSE